MEIQSRYKSFRFGSKSLYCERPLLKRPLDCIIFLLFFLHEICSINTHLVCCFASTAAQFSRHTARKNIRVAGEMKGCRRVCTGNNFLFRNNPPQRPPPLIIFPFLSPSPCLSFSHRLLSPPPSSRLQLHYRIISWATQHELRYLCLGLHLSSLESHYPSTRRGQQSFIRPS